VKVGPFKIGPVEVGPLKLGLGEIDSVEVETSKIDILELYLVKVCLLTHGTVKLDPQLVFLKHLVEGFSIHPETLTVEFVSQSQGAPESDYLSRLQYQRATGGWVPGHPLPLVFDTELAKPSDQNILIGFEGPFNDFQQGFDNVS